MPGFFDKQAIVAPPGFNRWRVPPASIAIHLCIGSVYAWSVFNTPLTRVLGVVASSADDWSLNQVTWIFSVAIVSLGLSAAVAGPWLERVGPRTVGLVSTLCWCGGFVLGGTGILLHELWLLYLGYGVIGGIGLGLGYVSPVSTLIRWFPDRRGMATGLAIMGFGGGAILGTPLKDALLRHFERPAQYLGREEQVELTTREGRRFAILDGQPREVVVVVKADPKGLAKETGVYVAGTGRTGVAETFFCLAGIYLVVMVPAALSYRIPAPGWQPEGVAPAPPQALVTAHSVSMHEVLKTPQFWLLWIVLCFNVTAGIGILSVAKTMMSEIFGTTLPSIVDATFASTYVLMTSVFNMLGRFFWASVSDRIGRKPTYTLFFTASIVLYLSIPYTALAVSASREAVWLVVFYAATMLIFTMYGGGFATIPAYLADLFGPKQVGAIHGRLLTAWSTAGVLGPLAITYLRERSLRQAMVDLVRSIEPEKFQQAFKAPISELNTLIERNTVTIPALLKLAPGAIDPTSSLYNSTMFLMAALLAIALVANLLVRPVDPKHWMD